MMRTVKAKDHEKLSHANIQKVITLLYPETGKAITKKEACEILNISYNTTRLDKIIQEYKERIEYTAKRRGQNKGKPASREEIQQVVLEHLQSEPISKIANRLYRSVGFVQKIIDSVGIPIKGDPIVPDKCIAENFEINEKVWSATYSRPAIVKAELTQDYLAKLPGMAKTNYEKLYNTRCYAIYVLESVDSEDSFFPGVKTGGFHAYSPSYELGKLKHLEEFGVDLSRI